MNKKLNTEFSEITKSLQEMKSPATIEREALEVVYNESLEVSSDDLDSNIINPNNIDLAARKNDKVKTPVRLMTSRTMGAAKAIKWLIRDMFPMDSIGGLFGPTGSMKTFAIMGMALSVCTGTPFHGKEVKQGSVLYVPGEGLNGINSRIKAWEKANNNGKYIDNFFITDRPLIVNDEFDIENIIDACEQIKEMTGEYPMFIIFDTLNKTMNGNENSAVDMTMYTNAMTRLRVLTGAAVTTVHHTGVAGEKRARGSNSLVCALDAEIFVSRNEQDQVVIENTKEKDSKNEDGNMVLGYEVVDLGYDEEEQLKISSVVLRTDSAAKLSQIATNKKVNEVKGIGKNQTSVLKSINMHTNNGEETIIRKDLISLMEADNVLKGKAINQALVGLEKKAGIISVVNDVITVLKQEDNPSVEVVTEFEL